MKKIVAFLEKNPVQYLATVGRDGKAKCRPFMFCLMAEDKLWFCTNSTKDVYYKFTLALFDVEEGTVEWQDEKEIRKTSKR